jgi:hypothetical protein
MKVRIVTIKETLNVVFGKLPFCRPRVPDVRLVCECKSLHCQQLQNLISESRRVLHWSWVSWLHPRRIEESRTTVTQTRKARLQTISGVSIQRATSCLWSEAFDAFGWSVAIVLTVLHLIFRSPPSSLYCNAYSTVCLSFFGG